MLNLSNTHTSTHNKYSLVLGKRFQIQLVQYNFYAKTVKCYIEIMINLTVINFFS